MGLTYFKRFRMEIDLMARSIPEPQLPADYRFVAWDQTLVDVHAEVKFNSFRHEIDANVFPCLGEQLGCQRLMHEIRQKEGFLPGATWLIAYQSPGGRLTAGKRELSALEYCGTIQGVRDHSGMGAIQNLGITPEHRGLGLGGNLLLKSLQGFQAAGLKRTFLEVTAQNDSAIRLYQRLGFAKARTVYKAVEVAYS